MTDTAVDLPYRLAWRTRTSRAGSHRSSLAGSGGMFRDLTSLMAARDPRRIDLRQSLRDPFEAVHVRRFEQTSAITVTVMADVSASMGFAGRSRKQGLLCAFLRVLGGSVVKTGDSFAVLAADERIRPELSLPATRSRAAVTRVADACAAFAARGAGAQGLLDAASLVPSRRGLVFLVSDFLFPEPLLVAVFERLARHDVIPIVLRDSAELEALPDWGLMELADLETGRRRLVVLRPSLKDAWSRRIEARRSALLRIASRFGREPFEVTDRIDWDRLGAQLVTGARAA